jgi:hypothetical protein
LTESIRPVDIEAFRNLIDPREEQFLRGNLSPAEFRAIHRQRLRAAIEYLQCAAHNASVLLYLGEAARQSAEPAIAEAGNKLVDNALRLRLYAFRAIGMFYLAMVFSNTPISPMGVAERYERMTRLVILLGCLQYPSRDVAAAL